jgi:hypothetical protein
VEERTLHRPLGLIVRERSVRGGKSAMRHASSTIIPQAMSIAVLRPGYARARLPLALAAA